MKTSVLFRLGTRPRFTLNARAVWLLLLLAIPDLSQIVLAQATPSGVVTFSNLGTPDDKRIWANQNGNVVRAAGSGYRVALYWGPHGTPESQLVRVGAATTFLTGTAAGTFTAGHRTVSPLSANGVMVTLQARGWSFVPGIDDTYEAVLAAAQAGDPTARVGKGPVFDQDTKDINDPS